MTVGGITRLGSLTTKKLHLDDDLFSVGGGNWVTLFELWQN